jgi:hypothetical protein
MKLKTLVAVVLFILCGANVAQAEKACTQMWCQEGTTVNLKSDTWPPGSYEFVITADDRTVTCKSALPFKACEGNTTCDGEGVLIGESGCALPPEAHSFQAIMLPAIPENIKIVVTHESGKTFSYQTPLEKNCFFPNGEGCDPKQCCSTMQDLILDWKE